MSAKIDDQSDWMDFKQFPSSRKNGAVASYHAGEPPAIMGNEELAV